MSWPTTTQLVREDRNRTWQVAGSVVTVQLDVIRPEAGVPRPMPPNYGDEQGVGSAIRRRKLVQWIAGYLAVACLVFQVTDALGGIWGWPQAAQRGITLIVALGALPATVIAWYHGEKGRQAVCLVEALAVAVLVVASFVLAWRVTL